MFSSEYIICLSTNFVLACLSNCFKISIKNLNNQLDNLNVLVCLRLACPYIYPSRIVNMLTQADDRLSLYAVVIIKNEQQEISR